MIRAMEMRKAASLAFHATECSQALRRAIESGPRPMRNFEVGETTYFWRVGLGSTRKPAPAYWHGPAKVVMTCPPSTIWLSYQGTLVKASPERVRRASEEEMLSLSGWIDALLDTRQELEKEPKRGFLDLTDDPLPPLEELHPDLPVEPCEPGRAPEEQSHLLPGHAGGERGDPQRVLPPADREQWQGPLPPVRSRLYGKVRVREPDEDAEMENDEPEEAAEESREISSNIAEPSNDGTENEVPSGTKREANEDERWEPMAKRSRLEYLELYYTKVASLIQSRQRKEVQIGALSKFNQECFRKAMQKEINNNISTGAYKPLTMEQSAKVRREQPEKIMESRYVTTAKPLEAIEVDAAKSDGLLLDWETSEPFKAKVRHVMKGFSEEGAELLDSTTPQVTREGVMMVTQIIASCLWRLGFLDFTQAFHSGDAIQRTLYAEQPKEGVPGMAPGQLLQLLKTCYGLTDGPFAWFSHIKRFLTEDLGYTQSIADPCIFMLHTGTGSQRRLRGIIGLATDDMIHGGDEEHQRKMSEIQKKYKLGKFQFDQGKFTGKEFQSNSDGSIFISQPNYAEGIAKIEINKQRSKQRYSFCTEDEISKLRTALGALSWLAKETRPELAGRVALLQQSMPKPRVQDLVEANLIIHDAKKFADAGIRIMPIRPEDLRIGVVSDASWGNSKNGVTIETNTEDFWEETEDKWIRHHRQSRSVLFHPGAALDGPELHSLLPRRHTVFENGEDLVDEWNNNKGIRTYGEYSWKGKTEFFKQPKGQALPHGQVNEMFLKLLNTSSQGGIITIFHDKNLETSTKPEMVTVASWKSTRLKRKTVNTLSAECQAMIAAVGQVHWFRFLFLEIMGKELSQNEWEGQLSSIPFVAVTDSRSLYDCLNKLVCTYTQTDDKRTAIDVAILKDDMQKSSGHARWIEGDNMICDPLTKKMKGNFLRAVASNGFWSLNKLGFEQQKAEYGLMLLYTSV